MEENQCSTCFKIFTEKKNLERHIISRHGNIKPHKCNICQKQFTRKENLNSHYRRCKLLLVKRDSAYDGIIAEWTITFPNNFYPEDWKISIRKSIELMEGVILDHLHTKAPWLKYAMSIIISFNRKQGSIIKIKSPKRLTTIPRNVFRNIQDSDKECKNIKEALRNTMEELFNVTEEYEKRDSVYAIKKIICIDTTINSF